MTYFLIASWLWMQSANPAYFIETIEVVNRQAVSAELIIAQTGFNVGGMIDEDQLRKAIRRIEQLPFVLSARFSLDKGSERGKYKLLIHIEESSKLFGDLSVTRIYRRDNNDDTFNDTTDGLTLGYRHFLGRSSMVYGSYRTNSIFHDADLDGVFSVGYANFDLLQKGILFTGLVNFRPGTNQSGEADSGRFLITLDDTWNIFLESKIPLDRAQWLNLSYYQNENRSQSRREQLNGELDSTTSTSADERQYLVGWEYNTTDDALLPTSGLLVNTNLLFSDSTVRSDQFFTSLPDNTLQNHSDTFELSIAAAWYWSPKSGHTWPLEMTLSQTDSDSTSGDTIDGISQNESNRSNAFATVGYQYRLPLWLEGTPKGDLYTGIRFSWGNQDNDFSSADNTSTGYSSSFVGVSAFLAYRGKWGIARFTLNYSDRYHNSLLTIQ